LFLTICFRSSLLEGGLEHVMPSMLSTENKGLIFYYYDMLKATFTAANYADLVEPGYTKPYKRLIEEVNRIIKIIANFSSETNGTFFFRCTKI
jgi:hypothetical protein